MKLDGKIGEFTSEISLSLLHDWYETVTSPDWHLPVGETFHVTRRLFAFLLKHFKTIKLKDFSRL